MTRASKPAPAKKAPARKTTKPKAAKPAAKVGKAAPKAAAKPARQGRVPLTEQLTPKVKHFIAEYLAEPNGTQAYLKSHPGVKETTARTEAARLLAKPCVQEAVAAARKKTAEKMEITRESLLTEIWGIVKADARELVEYVVLCCRHCHGAAHAFQWRDEDEFETACEVALQNYERQRKKQRPGEPEPKLRLPTDAGGFGFDPRRAPHPDCDQCLGSGQGRTVIKDTRHLSPQAAALYAGVKETEKGIEVKMHSKLDAAEKIAKHLGLYEKDNEQKGASMAQVMAEFVASLHARQAGRLPIAPAKKGPLK